MGVLLLLRDVCVAGMDASTGRQRRRYEHAVDISASRRAVWELLRASDLTFEGVFAVRIVTDAVVGRPGVLRMRIQTGDSQLVMLSRIIDERDDRAVLFEVLVEGTDPLLVDGEDDYLGYVLDDIDGGTRLTMTRELTVTSRFGRLTVPIALRSGCARVKRKAEQAPRTQRADTAEPGPT